jgi:GH25 family lysozyme M1 (1,4-beta-N-acetylmuramidase)
MRQFFTFLIAALLTSVAKSQSFNVGDNVQATVTLNIRSTANGTLIGQHISGDKGTIIGGPTYSAVSGYSGWWYQVQWQTSPTTGWCVQDYLQKVAADPCDIVVQGTPTISPNQVTAGNQITVSYTIKNQGGSTAAASQTKIQIKNSSGTEITASTFSDPSITAGGTSFQNHSVAIPSSAGAGTYTCYVILDNLGNIGQSNSQNDFTPGVSFTVMVPATPCDIVVQGTPTISPNQVTAGNQITISYTIKNQGGSTAAASQTKIQIKNPSGTEITASTFSDPSIAAGGTTYQSHPVTIPSSAGAGTYTCYVILDNLGNIGQGNTENDYTPGVSFTVNGGTSTPTITSISPNPVPGSNTQQTITINGSNFVSRCSVTLNDITNNDGPYVKLTTFISNSQIQITANFTNATANWTAQVTSPAASNVFQFQANSSGSAGISIPPFLSQRDPRWNSKILGATGYYTIGQYGCAMTCVAMLLKWVNESNPNIDPKILNDWLNSHNGYTNDDDIKWDVAANQDGPSGLIWERQTYGTDEWNIVDNLLNNGVKPIVKVNYKGNQGIHYVIIYDRIGPSAVPSSYKILDPFDLVFDQNKTLAFHSSSSGTIFGIKEFKGVPTITYPTPIITTVNSNNIVPGLDGNQDVYVNGANFVNGATVNLTWKIGTPTSKTLSASQFTISNSQVKMSINTTNVSDFWTVEIINPDGQSTGQFPFNVVSSGGQISGKIMGVDVSHWNGTINWDNVKNAGNTFAFIKCTESIESEFEDNLFTQNAQNAVNAGLVIGAYHIATPFYNSASDEANHFLSIASPYINNGNLPPALDLEPYYVNQYINTGHSYSDLSTWILNWINIVGPNTIIYTTGSVVSRLDNSLKNYHLWIADDNGVPEEPNTLGIWPDWKFHQYFAPCDACANGNPSSGMDQNLFNGDINAFNALISYAPLPVVLKSFNANSKDCSARLDWVSNVEKGFSYYAVERSGDGAHFSEITKIQPKPGESMEKEYSFVDRNPGAKTVFYRLRMVDKDGKSNYSNIITLKLDCLNQNTVSIFPTISSGVFNFRLSPGLEKSEITVSNSSGQVVYKYLPSALSGTINLGNLSSGIYLVRVTSNNNLIDSRKIIIAR